MIVVYTTYIIYRIIKLLLVFVYQLSPTICVKLLLYPTHETCAQITNIEHIIDHNEPIEQLDIPAETDSETYSNTDEEDAEQEEDEDEDDEDENDSGEPSTESEESNSETNENSEDEYDTDYDSDDEIFHSQILENEFSYEEREKETGKYYIGISYLNKKESIYLFNSSISALSFLAYKYALTQSYLYNTASYYVRSRTPIEILQLHIHEDGVYEVLIKTFWIRIVQRRWRKIYNIRLHILKLRSDPRNQEYFRRHGRYMEGSRVFPGLNGMLSDI